MVREKHVTMLLPDATAGSRPTERAQRAASGLHAAQLHGQRLRLAGRGRRGREGKAF